MNDVESMFRGCEMKGKFHPYDGEGFVACLRLLKIGVLVIGAGLLLLAAALQGAI